MKFDFALQPQMSDIQQPDYMFCRLATLNTLGRKKESIRLLTRLRKKIEMEKR